LAANLLIVYSYLENDVADYISTYRRLLRGIPSFL